MARKRDLRYFASVSNAIIRLIAAAVFVALGWLAFTGVQNNTFGIGAKIMGAALMVFFSLSALGALVTLLFRWVFRRPLLQIGEAGITYRAPLTPWRSLDVPWDDVRLMTFYTWGRASGRGGTTSTRFVIYTRHPARYASSVFRRLFAWWNPGLAGSTIVVSTSHLGGSSLKRRERFLGAIKAAFAPEIARYGIAVKPSM